MNDEKKIYDDLAKYLISYYEKSEPEELVFLLKTLIDIKSLIPFDRPLSKSEISVLAHDKFARFALSLKVSPNDFDRINFLIDNQNVN